MADIFVTGHRNPDMDSVCSAWAYANLKNTLDKQNTYIPVRCGNLNDATKAVFDQLSLTPPGFLKDVRSRLAPVVRRGEPMVDVSDPLTTLIPLFQTNPAAVGVMDGSRFAGLLTAEAVNSFFLQDSSKKRPSYHFVIDTIPKVLPGHFLKKGEPAEFTGPIAIGAMKYELFCEHMDAWSKEGVSPLWVFGDRDRHLQKAIDTQVPCIVLTGSQYKAYESVDLSRFKGSIFLSDADTSETLRLLRLSVQVRELLKESMPRLEDEMLFDEAKNMLHTGKYRALPVFHGNQYLGFVSRRCFMDKPRTKVILVDHNELQQSISGLEEAEILEIIDHHRVDGIHTDQPIYILCNPLGSTCTIVWTLYRRQWVPLTKKVAQVLLAGITSDTVGLKSPTTTEVDRQAVKDLTEIAEVADYPAYTETLFSYGASLVGKDPLMLVESDFKTYQEKGMQFGIGQCEVTMLDDSRRFVPSFFEALEKSRSQHGLDFALFLITDIVHENSLLLAAGMGTLESHFAYERVSPHLFFLPGVLSRKKQLLPEVVRVLEEG